MLASTLRRVRHNPWRAMRVDHPEWRIHFAPSLPWGALGVTRWSDRTVWLVSGLTQVQRRCVIEHERQHILRGLHSCDSADERAVDIATARTLIPLDALVDAARWPTNTSEVADALWVTRDVLRCRARHLHPSELLAVLEAVRHHHAA